MAYQLRAIGLQQNAAKLKNFATRGLGNKAPMYKRIGVELLKEISRNFDIRGGGGAYEGFSWAPLAKSTIKQRRKGSDVILHDSGTLRRSFTMEATGSSIKVGTPIKYSEPHEYGTATLPQRKILPTVRRGTEIGRTVADVWVKEKLREAGL